MKWIKFQWIILIYTNFSVNKKLRVGTYLIGNIINIIYNYPALLIWWYLLLFPSYWHYISMTNLIFMLQIFPISYPFLLESSWFLRLRILKLPSIFRFMTCIFTIFVANFSPKFYYYFHYIMAFTFNVLYSSFKKFDLFLNKYSKSRNTTKSLS